MLRFPVGPKLIIPLFVYEAINVMKDLLVVVVLPLFFGPHGC